MSPRHTAETRRIQARLERLELQHLRQIVAELGQQLDAQAEQLAALQRELHDAQDALDWQWRATIEMGERMEAEGTGRLGLRIDGTLCVLANTHQVQQ